MPLSWNEIRDRALRFSRDWAGESSEKAEAKSFWDAFFTVFGLNRRRVATFEKPAKKSDGHGGFIDLLWKGVLLVEHKSEGKNLDRAYGQARDYFPGLKDRELPRYIVVSDFARFRLYDLESGDQHEFSLKDLHKYIRLFSFMAGYQTTSYRELDPVNIKAAERMGRLHDKLKESGYTGHALEVYLVRLLFCLFADNTSIFERRAFYDLIEQRTSEDGVDLAHWLEHLFETLDTKPEKRLKSLDEQLLEFPYVNGSLFSERLSLAAFDREMREILLESCDLDWSQISPAVFGALFQAVMDETPDLRRHLGAHYTTEKNILKVITSLFLDDLREEFLRLRSQPKRLWEFQRRLASLKFLDPACGCGNFLVIAYRELRELELEVLRVLFQGETTVALDVGEFHILCDVDQFYGIEVEEFPSQIAQTALWLTDHQMNLKVSEEFGQYFVRLPLTKAPKIRNGNALRIDWAEVVDPKVLTYLLGNPPFSGSKQMSAVQRKEVVEVFGHAKNAGLLDYVAAWYIKARDLMAKNPTIKTAFVSTNSITQGDQVGILWPHLLDRGVKIHFAHRTFEWTSEAPGRAAVHCVIIGFALFDTENKRLFDYETPKSEAHESRAKNINPYLADAPDTIVFSRRNPLVPSPMIGIGNQPIDNGNYLFTTEEKAAFLVLEPNAAPYFRRWIGSREFIHSIERWCLWLGNVPPQFLLQMPEAMKRVRAVASFRQESKSPPTQKLARTPTRFNHENMPKSRYLVIPEASSQNRHYIPMGFVEPEVLSSNLLKILPDATIYDFGVLTSAMHMAWVRYVCGRLKSDYRYSNFIVYYNFPWPREPSTKQREAIKAAADLVLETRTHYPDSTLADLYNPLSMPADLANAHSTLDKAVDRAYSRRQFQGDADRVQFLFERYIELTTKRAPVEA